MSVSNYSNEFKKILDRNYFTKDLLKYRKDAFTQLGKIGFPNQKWEDWRFTNLSKISEGNFRVSELNDIPQKNIDLNAYKIDGLDTIVILNGHYQKHLSTVPAGVLLLNGEEYLNNNKLELANHSPFDLLNTAFVDSGINIIIEKKLQIDTPIRILFISNGKNSLMVNPRIYLEMEESSSLVFVEHHVGDAKSFFQNESLFISIKNNASLDHIRIQSNSDYTQNISNINVKQTGYSKYNFYQYSDGAQLARLNMHINLNGKGAECNVNGLAISKHKQHIDNNITINHNCPNTLSSQYIKTILFDNSSGVFNGKTVVNKDAQKIVSHQSNKNLLFSAKAKMNSNPQLEIYADDVKCSHGSTTGELDKDMLFYIQSRGLSKEDAIKLIVNGFANEIIKDIANENVSLFLKNKILNILESMIK